MIRYLLLMVLLSTPVWAAPFDADTISGLGARNIGSATMSGRVTCLTAVHQDGKLVIYVGAASGGVWKSLNGGTTYQPVFDKAGTQSIGAIALDPSNPKTLWVGTGEAWTRNSVSIGDGVYKSTDGGDTWTNMGLPTSERVARIKVDPRHGNTVYVAVPGKLWSDSPDRGIYKTTDGGKTWSLVLKGSNLSTGASDIAMDPRNPDVLFAGLWDFRRRGWTFRSGGDGPTAPSGSGLYHTTDGGRTWTDLTGGGLPPKPWGRVAVSIAPSNPQVVYALIESPDSALYRSDDGGQTWKAEDKSQWMVWRPFYFANLIVDPKDENRLYKTDLTLILSTDGGKSFSEVGQHAHADFHDVWIDPENTRHVIAGNDGGLWYSTEGGTTWWKADNLPISQFYHVSVDDADPYHVYGGLQDNSDWIGDSSYPGGVTNNRWENLYGGDGFWTFPDPSDFRYVYTESQGGDVGRVNRFTHEVRPIKPQPRYGEGKLRFNWNTPISLSPNHPGTVYMGAQYLFRSKDHGQTWDRISPDLTTNDPQKQKQEESGGVTVDNSAAEMHTTIYSISESPKDDQTIWVGTDDGNLQVTHHGGKSWTNVVQNVPGPRGWVSWVQASRYDARTAFACFDRHTFGDMTPYVYRTRDEGHSWQRLSTAGVRGWAHVIQEDTVDPDLLFLGTELGLWVSLDSGQHWAQFKGGDMPNVPVRDLVIQPRTSDLVIATHGRGIWIVDDIAPLRHLSSVLSKEAAFVPGRPTQQRIDAWGGWGEGSATYRGPAEPSDAVITYYQAKRHIYGRMKIDILDADGHVIDTLPANSRRGLGRVTWSMRLKPPHVPPAATAAFEASQGPRVLPGTYTVRWTRGEQVLTAPLHVTLDRRVPWTLADRKQQFAAAMKAYRLLDDMSYDVAVITQARTDLSAAGAEYHSLAEKMDDIRKKIVATKEGGAITGEERIREKAASLYGDINGYEGRPGTYLEARVDSLSRELADVRGEFNRAFDQANVLLKQHGRKPLERLEREEWEKSADSAARPPEEEPGEEHDRD
ncbi:MAG TPA: sialidase [Candidatus Xenobia bacterium]|jgi:photosystem II stability/assembly factor-like uncharacterized protein